MERNWFSKRLIFLILLLGIITSTGCTPDIERLEEEQNITRLIKLLGSTNPVIIQDAQNALARIGDPSVELLITALSHENVSIRKNIPFVLAEIGDVRAVLPLIDALRDGNWDVRDNAIFALGEIGDERGIEPLINEYKYGNELAATSIIKIGEPAIRPLIDSLDNQYQTQRDRVISLLAQIGDPAIPYLIESLDGYPPKIREGAIQALIQIGEPCVEELIVVLGDQKSQSRSLVIFALGLIGDDRAIEPLVNTLKEEDLASDGANALDKIGWNPSDVESEAWYLVTKGEFIKASELGFPAVEPLTLSMARYPSDDIVTALVKIGEPAVPSLIVLLINEWDQVRLQATNAIVQIGEPAVGYLIGSFNDEEYKIISPRILIQIGDPAVPPLIAVLSDDDSIVRQYACYTLGKIADSRAVEPIIVLLNDEDPKVRESAAYALGDIGDITAVKALIAALKDENGIVRQAAVVSLGQLGDVQALDPLITALGDNEPNVREMAAYALGLIGDDKAIKPLINVLVDEDIDVRKRSESALVGICREDTSKLLPYLNYSTTYQVYRVLIRLGDPGAVTNLINALNMFGTSEMAMIYLTCVNDQLEDAGEAWLESNGYWVIQRGEGGSEGYVWGSDQE